MITPPKVPSRPADHTLNRPSDGLPVNIWIIHRTKRSRDRHVNGTTKFGAVLSVDGWVQSLPAEHPPPDATLDAIHRIFTPRSPR